MKPTNFRFGNVAKDNTSHVVFLVIAAVILAVASRMPYGGFVFYPLALIGAWFHEFGHALTAILFGGSVLGMQIDMSGGGLTRFAMNAGAGKFVLAAVAAGGPIMPAIIGSLLIMSGKKVVSTKIALSALAVCMILSTLLFGLGSGGMMFVGAVGFGIFYLVAKIDVSILRVLVHILGIQGCISILKSQHYLSTASGMIGGRIYTSDTGKIAQLLGGSAQTWGVVIFIFSAAVLMLGLAVSFGFFSRRFQFTDR